MGREKERRVETKKTEKRVGMEQSRSCGNLKIASHLATTRTLTE